MAPRSKCFCIVAVGAVIDWLPLWLLAGREEKRRGDGGELVTRPRLGSGSPPEFVDTSPSTGR